MPYYPLPSFRFVVTGVGNEDLGFSEVTGLNFEIPIIEYRSGNSPDFGTVKSGGIRKYANVTLKRGTFAGQNDFFEWFKNMDMHIPERRTIIIELRGPDNTFRVKWTLRNAWPFKITSSDLKANANETAIESIELAHEGLRIEYGGSLAEASV